jgi:cell division protein FtsQ
MARKSSGTILQEELYPPSAGHSHSESKREDLDHARLDDARPGNARLDNARLVDLDVDEESPFLRGQKRVSARRSSIPKKTASRLLWACIVVAVLCIIGVAAAGLYEYGERSWRFRVDSSDNIDVAGMENVTKAQIMEVMGADIGRNIFFIPLAQQKAQLEQIPWVESASVMRFVPNRLRVEIHERTPVAFARVGPRISLIDVGGTLMELPQKHKYSFPVILGMNPGEPLSTRAPRMKAYNELVQELDSGGAHYSQDLSEVDLSDLENLKVRVNDPAGDVLVELGSSDYLKRYKTYESHVQEWRQQFQKLESVNLRYDNQVIVNPDMEGRPKQPALAASAAKAAAAAGVKPAALTTRLGPTHPTSAVSYPRGSASTSPVPKKVLPANLVTTSSLPTNTLPHDVNLPKPAFELTEKKLDPKAAAGKKPAAKPKVKKTTAKAKGPAPKKAQAKATSGSKTSSAKTAASQATVGKKPVKTVSAPAASTTSTKPSAAIAKQQANPDSD